VGDKINAILSAVSYNFGLIFKGVSFFGGAVSPANWAVPIGPQDEKASKID